jgi:Spy/CpxP family protein refolding chaperone
MDALAAERKKLREIMETDPVNPGAITAQTQRVAQLEAELNVARAQERAKVEAVLTPEQRAKWREMRDKARLRAEEKMRERIRERWEKRGKEKPEA